jgi:hypothetical protein
MFSILYALGMAIADLVKSHDRLEAEISLLRHQLSLALRHAPPRVRLHRGDRAFMIRMEFTIGTALTFMALMCRSAC